MAGVFLMISTITKRGTKNSQPLTLNDFDISDVAEAISKKLVFRHPHVYGDVSVADEEAVKKNWEKLKLKEGKKSVFEGVPKSLPALVKASRIQDKAAGVGFDWKDIKDVKIGDEVEVYIDRNQDENEMFYKPG